MAVLVGGLAVARGWRREQPVDSAEEELIRSLPRMNAASGFASSQQCRDCHPNEYASWHASYHRQMTQVARPDTVLGAFDGVRIPEAGQTHRLFRDDDQFWMESAPNAPATSQEPSTAGPRRVVMTTGAHHMQVYWAANGQGNGLDELSIIYIRDPRPGKSRWAPLQASYISPTPPGVAAKTTWNTGCILCHATGGTPGLEASGATDTSVAELGISCEACHGPAQEHVRLKREAANRGANVGRNERQAIVNPGRLPPERAAQVCGHCHSAAVFASERLMEDFFLSGSAFRPGDDLLQTRIAVLPARLSKQQNEAHQRSNPFFDGSFWSDGMIRVTGREYNGLLESTCYQKGGMTCLSCHSMHQSDPDDQLATIGRGNAACYQCHPAYRENLSGHTHHAADSQGSQCYNCHMPHTTYGLFKAIRSHQISSPGVASTLATGRTTACNLCHLDQTLSWSAEKLSDWYGQPQVKIDGEEAGFSAAGLGLLKGDVVQRALLTWHAGWEPALEISGRGWLPVVLAPLLEDPSPVIRLMASRSLEVVDHRYATDYDFMAPIVARQAASAEIGKIWETVPPGQRAGLPARVFIKPDGERDQATVERLLRQRDDRGLFLQE